MNKGTIHKTENGWIVRFPELKELPLHPDDVKRIGEWEQIFDNIEGRIASKPDVEFQRVNMDQEYAKLIYKLEPIVDEWKEIEDEYGKDEYPPFGGPFTNALTPWEWLRRWYNPPTRK